MIKEYTTLYEPGEGYYEEKKSKFLSLAVPVTSEEEVEKVLGDIRKRYYDASHNCYAYVLGKKGEIVKCSDDGEPQKTAGAPMLAVLQGSGIVNALVIVTRYFGGTLLGTGGLVRAYSEAARDALQHAVVVHKQLADILRVTADYQNLSKLEYTIMAEGLTAGDKVYAENVTFSLPVPVERTDAIVKKITDITSGRAEILRDKQVYYAEAGKQIYYFDE